MSRLKFMYKTEKEKEFFIKVLKAEYTNVKVSKEYKKGPHKRIYVDLSLKSKSLFLEE